MKHIFKLFLVFILSINLGTQAQNSFIKKLKTEKVSSTNTITWSQVSPGNAGYANFIRFHPTISGKVAISQDMWNHYQSDNNGARWYSTVDYDGDGRFGRMLDVEWCYTDAKTAISISTSELWVSRDTARTFELVKNCPWYNTDADGSDKASWRKKVAAVAIDPNDANTWFVAGGNNIRGQDWMSYLNNAKAKQPHGKPSEYEGKLWKTANAGKSWKLITKELNPKAQIGRIIVNPKNSKQIFASSTHGLYKSENGGKSWNQIGQKDLDNNIIMDMDFYFHPKTKKFILYVIDQVQYHPNGKSTKCSGGVFVSNNEGKSWKIINGDLGLDINQLTGGVPKSYYQFLSRWFGISLAQAKKQYPEKPKEALQYFNQLSTDPSIQGRIYVGFDDPHHKKSIVPGRLWVTENNGKHWVNTARLFSNIWKNDAAYWESRNNPWQQNMKAGHAHYPIQWGDIYPLRASRGFDVGADGSVMMINGHNTFLSTNAGKSWKQVDEDYSPSGAIIGHGNSNMPALTIKQDKREGITLLGAGEHRMWIPVNDSPDERQAIKFIKSAPETASNFAFDPYDAKTVYLTSNRQEHKQNIFKSVDGGQTWKIHGVATPASNQWLDDFYTNGLTIDPINNQYMYHGITQIVNAKRGHEGGFFRSENFGKTFTQSNKGLPQPCRINEIVFDPRDPSRASLFVAAQYSNDGYFKHAPRAEGGLYHSTDRGLSWKKINTPQQIKGVQFIKIDHSNRMYITTGHNKGGSGVWYTDNFGKNWEQIFKYPGAECIDVSPFDRNLIVITCRFGSKNPGVFVSKDRGITWEKSNKGLVQPQEIEDVKFDILEANKLWIGSFGTGFYKGTITNVTLPIINIHQNSIEFKNLKSQKLTAKIVNSYSQNPIVWKSENPAIAKVDQNGNVTPISKGQTKIWATTAEGRFSDYSVITVAKNIK